MTVYEQYVYSYPHKTAYGALAPAVELDRLWQAEDRSALMLYVHIPFCEQRCGFCNLFTSVGQDGDTVRAYLATLRRQARAASAFLGERSFARFVVGGGTPTYLDPGELGELFDIVAELGVDTHAVPVGFEVSPETATPDRLAVLRHNGVDRVSMGVQSFHADEVFGIHRRQPEDTLRAALEALADVAFPVLNLDLMYGLPNQTAASFVSSIDRARAWNPQELYLYPLYVRPLTRMGTHAVDWDDERLGLYAAGRDHLLALGWEQHSMRMFRAPSAPAVTGPPYRCQEDGMVGLGCGARSYTTALHYASAYAVGPAQVKALIREWTQTPDAEFHVARWGKRLNPEEQARRFAILGLLQARGLDMDAFQSQFGEPLDFAPLLGAGLAHRDDGRLRLTARGLAHSDRVGPDLFSSAVRADMAAWEAR